MKIDNELIREACVRVRDLTGFEDDAEIPTWKLLELLGTTERPTRDPNETDAKWAKRCDRHRLTCASLTIALKDALLTTYKVDLQATGRGAYRIVPPASQAARAEREGKHAALRELRKAHERIVNVELTKLDSESLKRRDAALLNTATRIASVSSRGVASVIEAARSGRREHDAAKAMPREESARDSE
jgi:hypothetical protein